MQSVREAISEFPGRSSPSRLPRACGQRIFGVILGAAFLAACSDGSHPGGGSDGEGSKGDGGPDATYGVARSEDLSDPAVAELVEFIDARTNQLSTIGKIYKGQNSQWKTLLPKPPQVTFDDAKTYFWNLQTNRGPIRVKLWPDVAPMHVSSTLYLTLLGFYDELKFHRVVNNFMAQGGCPSGTGFGSPGYSYSGEFKPGVSHDRPGLLSMANAGPGTDGSQFFLTFYPAPNLDGKHTVFGEILSEESMKTLRDLQKHGVPNSKGIPTIPLYIEKATISVE